jgi:hypothetical protein
MTKGHDSDDQEHAGSPNTTRAMKPAIRSKPTVRSQIFTEVLLANGGDPTKAARAAGYSNPARYGPHKASRPEIQALVQERIQAAAVGSDEVVGTLVMIMRENAAGGDPAIVRNAIASASLLCKALGIFQRPRANEQDQQTRDMFERLIERQMRERGLTRAQVVERIVAINPELTRWITSEPSE